MKTIIIEDYNPEWTAEFKRLKTIFTNYLGACSLNFEIEHVGSTSVPGLAAKPIIDFDIIVTNEMDRLKVNMALMEFGYQYLGEMGIEGRDAFCTLAEDVPYNNQIKRKFEHHLYVCKRGVLSLENHLKFRNYLREHSKAASEYGELKKDLAGKFPNDIDSYIEGKSEFITTILIKQGMEKEEIEVIRKQNKV